MAVKFPKCPAAQAHAPCGALSWCINQGLLHPLGTPQCPLTAQSCSHCSHFQLRPCQSLIEFSAVPGAEPVRSRQNGAFPLSSHHLISPAGQSVKAARMLWSLSSVSRVSRSRLQNPDSDSGHLKPKINQSFLLRVCVCAWCKDRLEHPEPRLSFHFSVTLCCATDSPRPRLRPRPPRPPSSLLRLAF